MHRLHYHTLEPMGMKKMQLQYLDTDSFVFSFDENDKGSRDFLQHIKDDSDYNETDKNHEIKNVFY